MKKDNPHNKQMPSMEYYIKNHKENYHSSELKKYQGEKRPDCFYTNLMKKILAWDEEIYKIGSVTDLNTYIRLITKYQHSLGYYNWSDIYTDNFYSILIHGYYNDSNCPNHYDTPLDEDIKTKLETHAHTLFSKKYQDEYQLTQIMQ